MRSQLARRFGQVELPAWQVDSDFRSLIATLLRNLPLRGPSLLDVASLQTVIRATHGNTARIFELFSHLAVAAIKTGEERITADAIGAWRPSVYYRSLAETGNFVAFPVKPVFPLHPHRSRGPAACVVKK
jgi:hypothetical protein